MDEVHYSVRQLADLSGVSVRTLHHYHQIGLLVPARQANGYRSYSSQDAKRLQQILLWRGCGLELAAIAKLLDSPTFVDERQALEEQLSRMREQRRHIDRVISNIERTLEAHKQGGTMTDEQRFEGLKHTTVEQNEQRFGKEARRRHGDAAVDAANERLLSMDERTWNDMNALEERIKELLRAAMASGDVSGSQARELVAAHARWLQLHWGEGAYTPQAHKELADGYLADKRFISYYDTACGNGATQFLHDAIAALA